MLLTRFFFAHVTLYHTNTLPISGFILFNDKRLGREKTHSVIIIIKKKIKK